MVLPDGPVSIVRATEKFSMITKSGVGKSRLDDQLGLVTASKS